MVFTVKLFIQNALCGKIVIAVTVTYHCDAASRVYITISLLVITGVLIV